MSHSQSAPGLSVIAGVVLVIGAIAQQPAKPPPLPPINPAAARIDQTVSGLGSPGLALAGSPTGTLLVAGCDNGTVLCWPRDVIAGIRVGERTPLAFEAHNGPVTGLVWIDGSTLASGGADKRIVLWEMPEGKSLRTLTASATVRALAASADGKSLASAEDAVVQLWNPATGQPGPKLTAHTDWVVALAYSLDGTRLASAGHDGRVRIWEVSSGKALLDFLAGPPPAANTAPDTLRVVRSLTFSPDGKQLAAGCSDGNIYVHNPADGKVAATMTGHASSVTAILFHPAGAALISGSQDRTIRLWNPANGQSLKVLEGHDAWVMGVVLLESGTRIASASADQTVRLWDLTPTKN